MATAAAIAADDPWSTFDRRLAALRAEDAALAEQIREYMPRRHTLQEDIATLERARVILKADAQAPASAKPLPPPDDGARPEEPVRIQPPFPLDHPRSTNWWARQLEGVVNQTEALVRIAELSGGTVRVIDVRNIILATGLSKSHPNVLRAHLYKLAERSGRFGPPKSGVLTLPRYGRAAAAEPDVVAV